MRKGKIYFLIIIILTAVVVGEYFWFNKKITTEEITVATINGEEITETEFFNQLKKVYGQEILNEMINRRVIRMTADKYGINVNPNEINRQINEFMQDYQSEEDYAFFLKEQMGWTIEQLYEDIEYNILWEEIATKDVNISEEEMVLYYNNNRNKYSEPEKFHIRQIVVTTKEEADQTVKELENGSNFSTLAKERSIDVLSGVSGGDLGYVSLGDSVIDPLIIEEAKKMEIDEISIIKLGDSVAVIQLSDRKDEIQYSFEEVEDEIRREIALNQANSLPEVLQQLKNEMGVEIFDQALAE